MVRAARWRLPRSAFARWQTLHRHPYLRYPWILWTGDGARSAAVADTVLTVQPLDPDQRSLDLTGPVSELLPGHRTPLTRQDRPLSGSHVTTGAAQPVPRGPGDHRGDSDEPARPDGALSSGLLDGHVDALDLTGLDFPHRVR